MRTLPVLLVGSVLMVLTAAADAESGDVRPAESQLDKRWTIYSRWSCYHGRCYRYIPKLMTWAAAEKHCQSLGGNLASVQDIMEYNRIQSLVFAATHAHTAAWLGGSDAQEEGHWLWSDGTTFNFANWCSGQPNNYGSYEHCMQMNYGAGKCVDDMYCSYTRPSVCAKNV